MAKELSTKNDKDLIKDLKDKREALRVFRFAGAGSKNKNVKAGKTLKKDIARILTAINAK